MGGLRVALRTGAWLYVRRRLLAEFAAGVGLAVEGLGGGSGAAHVAEEEDFDFEVTALIGHAQHVADADFGAQLWQFGGWIRSGRVHRHVRQASVS